MRGCLLLGMVAVMATCGNLGAAGGGGTAGLLPSLQVTTSGDSVHLLLQVTNAGSAAMELQFRSGQTYDFAVLQGERELWRWSNDQMFTMALRSERWEPGETRRYEAVWRPAPGTRGDFVAVGQVTAHNEPVEQRASFRLP